MIQQGQVFKLRTRGADGKAVWAYRYRLEGRGSERPQVGGFATRAEAETALRKALDRLGPGGGRATVTLAEFVDEYLEMHDAAPVTLAKLRWLLGKATAALGGKRLADLNPADVLRLADDRSAGSPPRGNPSAPSGTQLRGHVGTARLQPGQARRPEPGSAAPGEAAVRVVAAG